MTPVAWLSQLWSGLKPQRTLPREGLPLSEGHEPVSQDTLAAIQELSRAVRNNPDAVEIYLALGNLFRSQGEIERAVHIRESLIVRPGLDDRFRARAWYELGRDFKRAGLMDRALNAFTRARELWGDNVETLRELADLAAGQGDFEVAARHFERLHQPVAQAHYLVRLAESAHARGDQAQGRKWLDRALAVHPGSVEAWSLRINLALNQGNVDQLGAALRKGLENVAPSLRFLLMEALVNAGARPPLGLVAGENACLSLEQMKSVVLPVVAEHKDDLLLAYYAALLLLRCNEQDQARQWLHKAVALNQEFWPARLKLLRLDRDLQPLDPGFKQQLDFFVDQAEEVKRFVCSRCGIKSKRVFHVCPRCHSWHSIAFRTRLKD